MSKRVSIIFPHQLFKEHLILESLDEIYLIEEYLFFSQYNFHQQKIAFHRASMMAYKIYLEAKGKKVTYIDAQHPISDIRHFTQEIESENISEVHCIDTTDEWLMSRLQKVCENIELKIYENPLFLNSRKDLEHFFKKDKKTFFQTTFYKQQRKKRNILIDKDGQPEGGKWTFDTENRKKYPKDKQPPSVHFPTTSEAWKEAVEYTKTNFGENFGSLSKEQWYPFSFEEAEAWLDQFLEIRFHDFGVYEDAIVKDQLILNHSILSPLLNVGLLDVHHVVERSLQFAQENNIPINSTEGFIRQIIGWREFIRGMYEVKSVEMRTTNFWKFNRKIPASFYDGTTGIPPIDTTIKKVLKTGYCHHIERLMILGNFMLLCEFDPDEVYRWFMEMFIDAYDWVMVPNVYGMSQFADGGIFATKPYIGGSNYLKKMSDYPSGKWQDVWDGLYWRFVSTHRDFFLSNPRMAMMVRTFDKFSDEKQKKLLDNAQQFLDSL